MDILQIYWFILHYEWIFYSCMIIITMHFGYLENVGSQSCADLPNVDGFVI